MPPDRGAAPLLGKAAATLSERNRDTASYARHIIIEPHGPAELASKKGLEQARAEALVSRRRHGGPPLSSQSTRSLPSFTAHVTFTRPPRHDSAPYFVAFVASSCSARVCLGESSTASPEIFTWAGVKASR